MTAVRHGFDAAVVSHGGDTEKYPENFDGSGFFAVQDVFEFLDRWFLGPGCFLTTLCQRDSVVGLSFSGMRRLSYLIDA